MRRTFVTLLELYGSKCMSVLHGVILLQGRQTETHTATVSALDLRTVGGILEITHLLDRTAERLLGSGEDGLFYGGKDHFGWSSLDVRCGSSLPPLACHVLRLQ